VRLKALGVGQRVAPVARRQASHISCEWGGALPSCHLCSPTALPSVLLLVRAWLCQDIVPEELAHSAGPAAPAGFTPLARISAPYHRAGGGHLRRGRQRVRAGPAVPAETTSFTYDAARGHRAGWGHLQRDHERVRKGQRHPQASHRVRARRRLALVPEGLSGSAAVIVCDRHRQHQPAGHLSRGASRHAISPAVAAR